METAIIVALIAAIASLIGVFKNEIQALVKTWTSNKNDTNKLDVIPEKADLEKDGVAENDQSLDSLSTEIALAYSKQIQSWFEDHFKIFEEYAIRPELEENASGQHLEILKDMEQTLPGFLGGFYTLDENGMVLEQYLPKYPDAEYIVGRYDVAKAKRPYWTDVVRYKKPIVSNSFFSANRPKEILVIAVPRFNADGVFIGILDGVIDVDGSAPFSKMAKELLKRDNAEEQFKSWEIKLYLLDGNGKVLACSEDNQELGKPIGFNSSSSISATEQIKEKSKEISMPVKSTPFIVLVFWEKG